MFRFRRILCPVDFFPASVRAFRCAVGLAAKYKAAIHVLHTVPPVITAAYGAMISAEEITSDLQKDAKQRLEKLRAEAEAAGVSIMIETRVGDVDLQTRRAIRSGRPDLVVMGTHGRRGIERWIIGSVTERMIRHCPVPLLVVGPHGSGPVPSFGFRRILVVTDFSEGTPAALSYAFSIAREHAARVSLLHVVSDATADVTGNYREALLQGVEAKLQALVPRAGVNRRNVDVLAVTGSPSKIIPRILKRGKHDLLVMNIHGKRLIERALIGSTAERVVRTVATRCPILLIPPAKQKRALQASRRGRVEKG